jgi:hypothetical protein
VPNYLINLLPRNRSTCSTGCGYDVELLYNLSYAVYGFDPGARTQMWQSRSSAVQDRLRVGFAQDMPFVKKKLDYAYVLKVIEHVGYVGGEWQLQPNAFDVRKSLLIIV